MDLVTHHVDWLPRKDTNGALHQLGLQSNVPIGYGRQQWLNANKNDEICKAR